MLDNIFNKNYNISTENINKEILNINLDLNLSIPSSEIINYIKNMIYNINILNVIYYEDSVMSTQNCYSQSSVTLLLTILDIDKNIYDDFKIFNDRLKMSNLTEK